MKMPDYIKRAMDAFPGSFINHNNELILVPKFNVYFSLNDVDGEEDMLCKFCEWVSRECCSALRYKSQNRLYEYYINMTDKFNRACCSNLKLDDMEKVYNALGNNINHVLALKFVRSGFDMTVLS